MTPGACPGVVRSLLSPALVGEHVARAWGLAVERVRLLAVGHNDHYELLLGGRRAVVRVYRHRWRSHREVAYEVATLAALAARGAPVTAVVPRPDGTLSSAVDAPEGERLCAVFALAPGAKPRLEPRFARTYGRAVAAVHAASDSVDVGRPPRTLDVVALLDRPAAALRKALAARPELLARVADATAALSDLLRQNAAGLADRGFCHGDVIGDNVHVEGDDPVLFDFDFCCESWRAYDLASFRRRLLARRPTDPSDIWKAFLAGYTAERPSPPVDPAAVAILTAARQLWLLGEQSATLDVFGAAWFENPGYLDARIALLTELVAAASRA
jgi:Ser/Thr protein kinase RdoA (MazF antagonist)